jgi:RNA polymerase sigma-70 factor (ECF subfamily)
MTAIGIFKRPSGTELIVNDLPLAIGGHGESVQTASHEDARLMAGIRARDVHALEELYRAYRPRLTGFLMNLIHRPHVVEEAIDDTMMVVWNKPDSFRGACKLSTWIFAIAYRKALKSLRRAGGLVEGGEADGRHCEAPGPDEHVKRERVRLLLLDAIGQLTADHRAVIYLTYFQELGHREIAEIMVCPVSTVKTRVFHARRQLRRILAGDLTEWL